jgi:hypothetical protein
MPTRITCIRCRFFIETEPKPGESELVAAQLRLEDALDEGWETRDELGWYCPECAKDPWGPRIPQVQSNGLH